MMEKVNKITNRKPALYYTVSCVASDGWLVYICQNCKKKITNKQFNKSDYCEKCRKLMRNKNKKNGLY